MIHKEKVFILWKDDEIPIGTIEEILCRSVDFRALFEDIISDLFLDSEDETTIKLVIK